MTRILSRLLLSLCLFCVSSFAQSLPCTVGDHTEYTKKIKEFTTESFFNAGAPAPAPSPAIKAGGEDNNQN